MKPKEKKNEKVEPEDLFSLEYSAFKRDFGGRKPKCSQRLHGDL